MALADLDLHKLDTYMYMSIDTLTQTRADSLSAPTPIHSKYTRADNYQIQGEYGKVGEHEPTTTKHRVDMTMSWQLINTNVL